MKLSKRLFQNSLGHTLTELMLAVGILSIVVLSGSTLVYQLMNIKSSIYHRDQINNFLSSLSAHFNNSSLCTATLAGNINVNAIPVPLTINNFTAYYADNSAPAVPQNVAANFMITRGARLKTFEIVQKPGATIDYMYTKKNPGQPDLNYYRTQMQVKVEPELLQNMQGNLDPQAIAPRYFEFSVITTSNVLPAPIVSCAHDLSMHDACRSAGGQPSGDTCDMSKVGAKKCQVLGSYTVYSQSDYSKPEYSNPSSSLQHNPLTGDRSCPQGSIPTVTGGHDWNKQFSCGKKCTFTVNYSEVYYSCLVCDK